MIHVLLLSLLILGQSYDQATEEALAKIGKWDGKTMSAELTGSYEDPIQQEIPFGRHSYFLSPWRAYMDTQPVSQYLNALGVGFNPDAREADAVGQLLQEAGFHGGRIEIGWGSLDYDHPDQINRPQRLKAVIQAMQKHHLRPLVLLNAHSGWPCPGKSFRVQLLEDAAKGSRRVHIKTDDKIKIGYSGFHRLNPRRTGWPIIVSTSDDGWYELSAPLPDDIKAGQVDMVTRMYLPFAGAVFEDGTPNPHAYETVEGWKQYVKTICNFMKQTLQTDGKSDAGFDLEVWNEYTFGSDFLQDRYYYDPQRKFKEPIRYANHDRETTGHEIILPITVDYVNDPANALPCVRVVSGFSNQRPWDNGSEMWPGQSGISRHYYSSLDAWRPAHGNEGTYSPSILKDLKFGPVNAMGLADGIPDHKDWHTVVPGSFFIPTFQLGMPEAQHFGYKTEFMTRDIQPFPGPWSHHHRFSHPGDGRNAQIWMTETNVHRFPYLKHEADAAKVPMEDPRVSLFAHEMAARTMIRSYLFYSHKGVSYIDIYALKQNDFHFSVIPDAFFPALKQADYQLTDAVRSMSGKQLATIKHVTDIFKQGKQVQVPRALKVVKLVEHKPRLVFAGDDTPEHPSRYNRDDFAVLPFAMDQNRYVVAYYVVTRNMMHEWQPQYDHLDIQRYSMPPQRFDLTLSNVRGKGLKVSVYDPIADSSVPVEVLDTTANTMTVKLDTVDYPRLLLIDEEKEGPAILGPQLSCREDGKAVLRFSTNVDVQPLVSWGTLPLRESDGTKLLPVGKQHEWVIDKLRTNAGVKITMQTDDLTTIWPRWGHDVAGVLDWNIATRKRPTSEVSPMSNFHLPILSPINAPQTYQSTLPDKLSWKGDDKEKTLILSHPKGDVQLICKVTDTPPNAIAQLLPELSMTDKIVSRYWDWGNRKAILMEIGFDMAAHPGLKTDSQRWYVTPYGKGTLVLQCVGESQAMKFHMRTIEEITMGFVLR